MFLSIDGNSLGRMHVNGYGRPSYCATAAGNCPCWPTVPTYYGHLRYVSAELPNFPPFHIPICTKISWDVARGFLSWPLSCTPIMNRAAIIMYLERSANTWTSKSPSFQIALNRVLAIQSFPICWPAQNRCFVEPRGMYNFKSNHYASWSVSLYH